MTPGSEYNDPLKAVLDHGFIEYFSEEWRARTWYGKLTELTAITAFSPLILLFLLVRLVIDVRDSLPSQYKEVDDD